MEGTDKKVLIITYYWPPSGGSGVQRWLKFVKYLPSFGWQPFVFTPDNPAFDIRDESLLSDVPDEAEVMRFPIWEPYEVFFKLSRLTGSRHSAKPTELVQGRDKTFFQKIATWVRANVFIPDPRIFWVRPSVSFLESFLRDNQIQTVVTTGPPHSLHLIGLRLKKKDPSLRWIADFRDPWSEWGLLDTLDVGARGRKKHRALEAKVLASSDEVLTITPFYVRRFETLSGRRVHLIANGYDESDFPARQYARPDKFVIRHVGVINEKCDPRPFMRALENLAKENEEFAKAIQLVFNGEVHPSFRGFIESSSVLKSLSYFSGNIPHSQLLDLYYSSSVLLIVLHGYKDAEGYMPGKLFEYLATGLPVLGVGPVSGDAAALLRETGSGEMLDSRDAAGMRSLLLRHFENWKQNAIAPYRNGKTSNYSRQHITGKLVELLENDRQGNTP